MFTVSMFHPPCDAFKLRQWVAFHAGIATYWHARSVDPWVQLWRGRSVYALSQVHETAIDIAHDQAFPTVDDRTEAAPCNN